MVISPLMFCSVGDSYDNALAETINGLYKTEVIRRRGPWKNIEKVEYTTLEWVDWFNNRRSLEPISDANRKPDPPPGHELMWYGYQFLIVMCPGYELRDE